MISNHARLTALLSAILAAASLRLVPHPPNFSPIDAMALFSGAYLGRRWLAFAAPFLALLLSDAVLGFYQGMEFQYVSVVLIVILGAIVLPRTSIPRVGAASLASSILFFVVSNFGVWLAGSTSLHPYYAPNVAGLIACYVSAIPYWGYTVAGDLFYSAAIFGLYAFLTRRISQTAEHAAA